MPPTVAPSTRSRRRTREGANEFFERWQIGDEPGEVAIVLEGDIGLVPLGGD